MRRIPTVLLSCTLFALGCAGELDDPESFEGVSGSDSSSDGGDSSDRAGDGQDRDGYGTDDSSSTASSGGSGASACGSVASLLNTSCGAAGCHGAAGGAGGLDLASSDLGTRLLDQPASAACEGFLWIDSAAPENSLVYLKLGPNPPCGATMPLGGSLSEDDKACVLEWLEAL